MDGMSIGVLVFFFACALLIAYVQERQDRK